MKKPIIELVEKYITPQWRQSSGSNIGIRCPFHKGGKERRPSFFINTDNGLYFCHTCHLGGSIIRLLSDLNVPKHIIDLEASEIKEQLAEQQQLQTYLSEFTYHRDQYLAEPILSETVLMKFESLTAQNNPLPAFNLAWLNHMELCIDRSLNRLIYPIRDIYGNLAGISGGRLDPRIEPKYLIYAGGYRDQNNSYVPGHYGEWFDEQYPRYEFNKKKYIWNYDRVYARLFHSKTCAELYIVEGFKACLWMLQNGYPNTIALMGSSISDIQVNLLMRLSCNLILFLDNDDAGKHCTKYIVNKFRKHCKVLIIDYPITKVANQPDDFTKLELDELVNNKRELTLKEIIQWKSQT